ncbi:hypothetical protein EDC96DRAFT_505443 [Choanephora cucurbitarum]|nr:hypothetical protein EDC96DRAFT_505443 [Choanephora cucurbitarum]
MLVLLTILFYFFFALLFEKSCFLSWHLKVKKVPTSIDLFLINILFQLPANIRQKIAYIFKQRVFFYTSPYFNDNVLQ